jgi:5'-deoxy-5'-methylthioadenosine phosphorylase
MSRIGIIGGSGLTRLRALEVDHRELIGTPYGDPSAPMLFGRLEGLEVAFLPRHGGNHQVPPHMVNYRANIWAFKEVGVERVIGMAAVGGIGPAMAPGRLCVPDQIIDYTHGRKHTFYEQDLTSVIHIDFTEPYCGPLRDCLIDAGRRVGVDLVDGGVYGATQGPRLETRAEIQRMARDGCDVVGMTGMPEAALARELELCYANLSLVVNWAAGLGDGGPITMREIERHLEEGMSRAVQVVSALQGDARCAD